MAALLHDFTQHPAAGVHRVAECPIPGGKMTIVWCGAGPAGSIVRVCWSAIPRTSMGLIVES